MNRLGFFKKEIYEILKTKKIYILPAIFLFFGLTSPLIAKMMPEILKASSTQMGPGVTIKLPDPTFIDAYAQFFNNMNQFVIIALVFIFMGMVVEEKIRGTATLVLTKCVSRTSFILSKFFANFTLLVCSYFIAIAGCLLYTYLLFDKVYHNNLWLSFLSFGIYAVLILSICTFTSTISKGNMMSAGLAFLGFVILTASSAVPNIDKYSPGSLGGLTMKLLLGTKSANDAVAPIIVSLTISIVLLWGSVRVFKKQEV